METVLKYTEKAFTIIVNAELFRNAAYITYPPTNTPFDYSNDKKSLEKNREKQKKYQSLKLHRPKQNILVCNTADNMNDSTNFFSKVC